MRMGSGKSKCNQMHVFSIKILGLIENCRLALVVIWVKSKRRMSEEETTQRGNVFSSDFMLALIILLPFQGSTANIAILGSEEEKRQGAKRESVSEKCV